MTSIAWSDERDTPYAIDTQPAGEHPPTAAEAASLISVPDGFRLTLFAGDPHVHQPIAFDIDDRGRLWVVECYTYEGGEYDLEKRDRVLILEDTSGDGTFDRRKVFWDKGERLTGITLGFDGVWLTSAPHLLFLPDADQNDAPDGPPQIKLDGFSILARHNMVNGLCWGPDGWLYGRHGITDSSTVGTPHTPLGKRIRMNCSIWRYHPQRDIFEVVTNGTTNPWGLDYDDHGQWFFTNNVINHLWHVVPGAHYQRMFGDNFNPHVYELIEPTADHFHWDTAGMRGEASNKNRKQYDGRHDSHGGGHSHAGGMIYLGDNWPDAYRGLLLTCNTHGRRVNADRLVRDGNSYVGQHESDFLLANNDWFRGVELKYGPDGGVFITDWSDLGECHDRDGVHRTSGRIYKVTHGQPEFAPVSLSDATLGELVELQLHENDWYVRHARRILQERSAAGHDLLPAKRMLHTIFDSNPKVTRRLRAMWALYSIGDMENNWLLDQLDDTNEHIRAWAVRLLVDQGAPGKRAIEAFVNSARHDPSGLVRLYLASSLQRLEFADRWAIASALASHGEDADDRVQPLMIWYGIEAAVPLDPSRALNLAKQAEMRRLRTFIARRITHDIDEAPDAVAKLLDQVSSSDTAHVSDYLEGMVAALSGRHRVEPPENWNHVSTLLHTDSNASIDRLRRELAVVFGDGRAVDELLKIAKNARADAGSRRDALRVVIENQPVDLIDDLLKLKNDKVVGADAIRGLARYNDAEIPKQLLNVYRNAKHDLRPAIIDTLASRPNYATALLDAMEREIIEPSELSASAAGVIAGHGDKQLLARLEEMWGTVRPTPEEKRQLIDHYRLQLTEEMDERINLASGRQVFDKVCATCHKMFGEGKEIGPDLTGSNRDNLEYLLENIVDPGRVVPVELRQSLLLLTDGSVLTGTLTRQTDQTLTVQTEKEELTLPRERVDEIRKSDLSLMPEGLLTPLTTTQIRIYSDICRHPAKWRLHR